MKMSLKYTKSSIQALVDWKLSVRVLHKSYSMFYILLFFVLLCELSGSSPSSLRNEANFHKEILTSLNVTELNVTTLNVLLTKLKLRNCRTVNTKQGGLRCVSAEHLFETHRLDKSKKLNPREFAELTTSILYALLPNNAEAKFSQNGDNHVVYELFLQYYKTNGLICARLLDIILRDLKRGFNDSVTEQKNCVSAMDFFKQMNLSTEVDELDREQFNTISIMIISYLLNGRCLDVTSDLHELPCRSYFTFNLLGSDGLISFDGFKEVLESIGLGKESNHNDSKEASDDHDHDHLRKRRDISDTLVTSPTLNASEHCYSANDLAEIFLVNKSFGVDSKEFGEICPALIQQLKSNSCAKEKNEKIKIPSKNSDNHVWLYGFVSVLIISLLSLAGIAVIPTMKGRTYKKIVIVLVGLAIGTLTGDALFHLIPHAAGFHADSHGSNHGHSEHENENGKAFLWKFLVVASGIYGFFLFETFTHLFLQSGGHGHSHIIEHTRKHSPFERNNSCRTVERHEMRLASSPLPETADIHDTTQVIFNQVSGKTEEKCSKSNRDDHNHEDNIPSLLTDSHSSGKKKISSVGWMIIIGDTIHNITDGIAIGAAFTQDIGGGLSTSIAVFCHELPHELGDFAVLISSGMTVKQALLANFLSACSSFIGLVIGTLIGQQIEDGNQWVFAVMGGMFLYIALVDMLPELMHSEELASGGRLQTFFLQNTGILLGFIIMLLIAYFEEDLIIAW